VNEVTRILNAIELVDTMASGELLRVVYDELRKLAAQKMAREAPGHTLQPTALVHEAWLGFGGAEQPTWRNRARFFAAASEAMRRILIDNARRKKAACHGGRWCFCFRQSERAPPLLAVSSRGRLPMLSQRKSP
jgi:RNA polymerase sigma factor (TIGR02999 family)